MKKEKKRTTKYPIDKVSLKSDEIIDNVKERRKKVHCNRIRHNK